MHVSLTIEQARGAISWEFKSEGGDIGFQLSFSSAGLTLAPNAPGATVVLPMNRVASHEVHEAGTHTCVEAGTYVLTFDNTSSWVSSRKVLHRVEHRVTL